MKLYMRVLCLLALIILSLLMITYLSIKENKRTHEPDKKIIYRKPSVSNTGNRATLSYNMSTSMMSPTTPVLQWPSLSKREPHLRAIHKDKCSTIHVAMVATGMTEGIVLYNTLKSVFMHRSTPLYFHFIVDKHTKLVLQGILDAWLLPGVSHDYYFVDDISDSDATCKHSPFITLFNLKKVLPKSVNKIIAIEPTSMITLDLLQILLTSELHEDEPLLTCRSTCGSYCPGKAEPQPIGLGVMVINYTLLSSRARPVCSVTPKSIDQSISNNITRPSKDVCKKVEKFDGETLRYREEQKCSPKMTPLMSPVPPKSDKCATYEYERNVKRREVPHMLGHSYTARDEYDVTLSLQLSVTRLSFLKRILDCWDGPASVAIHVTDSELESIVDYLKYYSLHDRLNVTYHLVFSVGILFPNNVLREVSRRYVSTPFFLLMDIDFVLQPGLYGKLHHKLTSKVFGNTDKLAIVIPCFETFNNRTKVPTTKSEMVKLFGRKEFVQFHGKGNPQAEGATDYSKWKTATAPYHIKWRGTYEPYTVLEKSAPTFAGQFLSRFWNKAIYFTELHMAGYTFIVVDDLFVVHYPHSKIDHGEDLGVCGNKWYKDWLKQKKQQYGYKRNDVW